MAGRLLLQQNLSMGDEVIIPGKQIHLGSGNPVSNGGILGSSLPSSIIYLKKDEFFGGKLLMGRQHSPIQDPFSKVGIDF